jgi:hypothetical protein
MDDANLNPVSNQTDAEVHITVVFRGLVADPAKIYDGVQAMTTAANQVRADHLPARNHYSFIVTPA